MGLFVPVQICESKSCLLPQCELAVTITGTASINIGKGFIFFRDRGIDALFILWQGLEPMTICTGPVFLRPFYRYFFLFGKEFQYIL
ncbi:MAG: hypothetical protein WCL42_09125, partial [Chlorobiaceae bacterium]